MNMYEVGEVYNELRSLQEGVRFDMTDKGGMLVIYFNKPTNKEIKDVREGQIRFRMFVMDEIIFILSKFGTMPWMDSPYHVALSKNLTSLGEIEEGEGYSCNIILVDSSKGKIEAMRLISFNSRYSRELKKNIESQQHREFNEVDYNIRLSNILNNYTTKRMVDMSTVNHRITRYH